MSCQVPLVHSQTCHSAMIFKLATSMTSSVLMTDPPLLKYIQVVLLLALQPLSLEASMLVPMLM